MEEEVCWVPSWPGWVRASPGLAVLTLCRQIADTGQVQGYPTHLTAPNMLFTETPSGRHHFSLQLSLLPPFSCPMCLSVSSCLVCVYLYLLPSLSICIYEWVLLFLKSRNIAKCNFHWVQSCVWIGTCFQLYSSPLPHLLLRTFSHIIWVFGDLLLTALLLNALKSRTSTSFSPAPPGMLVPWGSCWVHSLRPVLGKESFIAYIPKASALKWSKSLLMASSGLLLLGPDSLLNPIHSFVWSFIHTGWAALSLAPTATEVLKWV